MKLENVRVLLFDLDGTLLGLDINAFSPVYFEALSRRFGGVLAPDHLVNSLMSAASAMIANRNRSRSNQEVFWSVLVPLVGLPRDELDAAFQAFYREDFPALSSMARAIPEAQRVLEKAVSRGYRLVLATNPIFPQVAIRERMRWAHIDDYPFELVTAYENMHACKPQPEYYNEILDLLRVDAAECMMVGNDAQEDMAASLVGLRTYLVEGPYLIDRGNPRYEPDYRGTLLELGEML
jgi:FMN phosphatase YigB (HAD superfamily)